MANLLWGQVYFKDQYAGVIRQESGGRVSFAYDESYLSSDDSTAIAYHLPLQPEAFISLQGLPPFFDNLVAEGWLEQAQTRVLGRRKATRFELLLAYGYDCAGAVSVLDPEPVSLVEDLQDRSDPKEIAVLTNRASLSGVQPKLSLIQRNDKFYPSKHQELSTHIAKFPSRGHGDLVENEYLTMLAFQALLPSDNVVEIKIDSIEGVEEPALIIKRFDRENGGRLHFEEFNQLLNLDSFMKYDGAYKDLSHFITNATQCLPTENYKLFLRICAGLLLGNTDMHFKNFAMFHTDEGLRLTPSYDQVAAILYDYTTVALAIAGASNLPVSKLRAKSIIRLGREFGLSDDVILMATKQIESNVEAALEAVVSANFGSMLLKNKLTKLMRKKWNAMFASIGTVLSKKP